MSIPLCNAPLYLRPLSVTESLIESVLTMLDDAVNFRMIQKEISQARTPGTGASFISGKQYLGWRESEGGFIWAKGMRKFLLLLSRSTSSLTNISLAGAGKTYLASVTEHTFKLH